LEPFVSREVDGLQGGRDPPHIHAVKVPLSETAIDQLIVRRPSAFR
jgi:hypothetical protein